MTLINGAYCTLSDLHDRLLIVDNSYDSSLIIAAVEASRLVDDFLKPYTTVPLSTVNQSIEYITADFSASVFKRRMTPNEVTIRGTLQPDMINDMDGTGWFGLGIRKLEQYIKNYYTLAEKIGTTTRNPDIYLKMFKQGTITGVELRQLINSANNAVIEEVKSITTQKAENNVITNSLVTNEADTITKDLTETLNKIDTIVHGETNTLVNNITDTKTDELTKNVTDTLNKTDVLSEDLTKVADVTETNYVTKKQNSIVFVHGKYDGDWGYDKQETS